MVNDSTRAFTGKDPRTGKELSTKERLAAKLDATKLCPNWKSREPCWKSN
ncbi:pre-toxin TG domain-containing protein [Bacillus cereus]